MKSWVAVSEQHHLMTDCKFEYTKLIGSLVNDDVDSQSNDQI